MPAQSVPVFAPLPKSHYFLTVSRGTGMRTYALRAVIVHALVCVLPVLALVGTGATSYVLFHDDVVASLMARQGQMQYAYEDRLDAMRGELQRQAVHDTTDRANLETRLHDLLMRESKLESRADLVASLADLNGAVPQHRPLTPRQANAATPDRFGAQNPLAHLQPALPSLPAESLGYVPQVSGEAGHPLGSKPRPDPDTSLLGAPSAPSPKLPESFSAIDPVGLPLSTKLALAKASLDKVERTQVGTLLRIGSAAREEATRLTATLEEVGLSADRFHRDADQDQGGPFVPLPADRDTPFGQAMANLQDTLSAAARLRGAVTRVPLADPLPGAPDVTSPFGARLDPFLGRPALHTGVDLRESYGTDVKATAPGRVVSAGPAGGYGNMVEVDHGNGLVTRYAHMEEILVADGQTVDQDTVLGRVGATGRATGPHLHYEIRVDNEPVDPMRYLNVGLRLAGPSGH